MPNISPFYRNDESYIRNLNIEDEYIKQSTYYLHINTGKPLDECEKFVINELKTNQQIEDPEIEVLYRDQKTQDRSLKKLTLKQYIKIITDRSFILSPPLTLYLPPSVKKSILGSYTEQNLIDRYIDKELAFQAKIKGDEDLYKIMYGSQYNKKIANNSLSGAHVSPSTPLANKTAHATLTSVTRTIANIACANNEKLISGNRHYYNPHVVLNNITSIITHIDKVSIINIINKYNLHYPTVNEVMDTITYSTNLYWRDKYSLDIINDYVSNISNVERAAFVYTGDLYHIRKYNPEFMRLFIKSMCNIPDIDNDIDAINIIETANKVDGDLVNLAMQICNNKVKGFGKKLDVLDKKGVLKLVATVVRNISTILTNYSDFISTFVTTDNIPASVGEFPNAMRRVVLVSNTDSTIFTPQEWAEWYLGELKISEEAIGVAATMVYISSKNIYHILTILSANFGYDKSELHRLAMKNEFRFDVFVPTQVGNHYYAAIGCVEGNILNKYDYEIKGVNLKTQNIPAEVVTKRNNLIESIMNTVLAGNKISLNKYIQEVLDIEDLIRTAISIGDTEIFKINKMKDFTVYKSDDPYKTPYTHTIFWNEVFGSKYGYTIANYIAVKIPTTLTTKRLVNEWLDSIEDTDIQNNIKLYLSKSNKSLIGVFMLPLNIVNIHGIPPEILKVVEVDRIIKDVCRGLYIVLDTLGYYKDHRFTLTQTVYRK